MQNDNAELHELERLAVLEATALLDSPVDEDFDQFTRLATSILQTPVALVSLVGQDRQFFKSSIGIPAPWAIERQTPLSHSFCKHVVSTSDPLIVVDARIDPLLKDNLAIPDLGVVAYLGMPLTTSEGYTLGSFCVIDGIPREWTNREVEILRDLAALVIEKIELRLLVKRLHADHLKMRNLELHREEMLQMLVHDLRNPMTSFLGGLELIQRSGGLTNKQKDYLGIAESGGEMLLRMINNILDTSKAEAGQMQISLTEVIPAQLIDAACKQIAPMAEKFCVKLLSEADEGLTVTADAQKLHRVLINLVCNAIQHTSEDGEVTVSAQVHETNTILFAVQDSGCGIQKDAFEQIFQKFESGQTQKVTGESTGLGLPFSRMVIDAHGGRIWVESALGKGTSFYFTIPM